MPYLIAIVLVAIGGSIYYFLQDNTPVATKPEVEELVQAETSAPSSPEKSSSQATDTPTPATNDSGIETSDYKNGIHNTSVTYLTPKRDEYAMTVSLTLTGDIVTDASINYSQGAEKDPNAQRFEAAYKAEVIGKDIDTINLSRVGGASLTTGAFNDALANIKTEAKS